MRKEVILAITIGLALGLIITFGVYTANKATQTNVVTGNAPTPVASVTPSPNTLFTLSSPSDGDILNTNSATISGKLKPGSQLIILDESEDLVVTPNPDGTFSQTIKLVSGANLIHLYAVGGDVRQEQQLNLVFSTTKYE